MVAITIPSLVYHYTKRETALEHILPSAKIRFGSLGGTNDPRETKEWGFIVMDAPQGLATDQFFEEMAVIQNTSNDIRQNEWWGLSLSRNDLDLCEPKRDRPDFSHFKYGYAHPRMWAQYAQNHAGVCLEFDGLALHQAILLAAKTADDVFFGNVEYVDEFNFKRMKQTAMAFQLSYSAIQTLGIANGLRVHIRDNYPTFFLEKTPDWKSESEFRWLVNSQQGPLLVDIRNAITSVIVGVDFPSVYGPCVRTLCDTLEVRLERMFWNNRVPIKQPWEMPI